MEELISQRLVKLRKHLGERLGHELAQADLAEQAGIKDYMYQRLETGLKGTILTLVTLFNFYRSHGYNLDWILAEDNSRIPMMVSEGNELLQLSQEMMEISQLLERGYTKLNGRLRIMGYRPQLVEADTDMPVPVGLDLS